MSDDIVSRLRAADEWMRVGLEGVAFHDDAPFDAADEIERLHAPRDAIQMLADDWRVRCGWARRENETLRAERDALRALLREAREYTGYAAYGDRIEADHAVDLCARIDATLSKGGGDE